MLLVTEIKREREKIHTLKCLNSILRLLFLLKRKKIYIYGDNKPDHNHRSPQSQTVELAEYNPCGISA